MMSLVKSIRHFEAILSMWGIDENKKLLLERNKINQISLKPQMNRSQSPSYIKQKKGVEFTDENKLEAMMMYQIGFEGKVDV